MATVGRLSSLGLWSRFKIGGFNSCGVLIDTVSGFALLSRAY